MSLDLAILSAEQLPFALDLGGSSEVRVGGLMVDPGLFEALHPHPTLRALRLVLLVPVGVPEPADADAARMLRLPCSAEELGAALQWLANGT